MDTASFFEFHNFTDLRWDENAKVIEPESAESLTPLLPKNTRKIQESPLIENPPPSNSQESFLYPTNI